ncbi:MAG: 16S rRNA (cytosine(1402)-N(4))-methyltransferase RsmH [Clostridiales bacterium]|nr:16S rRNA (cytosine(1402)-N(4))-methyltransferase RsmH [Clostridiales bacterium]
MTSGQFYHLPVLLAETLAALKPCGGGLYIDGTVGGAGHAEALLRLAPDIRLIGLDRDEEALKAAAARLAPFEDRVQLYHSNFSQIKQALAALGFSETQVSGVLLDIGVSSHQLDTAERGFSYMQDGPLDMRMDSAASLTAADIVNTWEEGELSRVLYEYGEERWARRIAAFIVAERAFAPIKTTMQLVGVIKKAVPKGAREADQHPAKRSFMALRIVLNDELTELNRGLEAAKDLLKKGGRLAVISFHSLESRIVKEKFRYWASSCVCPPELPVCVCGHKPEVKIINRRPVVAGAEELKINLRAKSAQLRAVEKL